MSIVIIGAGRKAEHLCDLFALWERVSFFYDKPREVGELKRDTPVTLELYEDANQSFVLSCVGDTRDKRALITRFIEDARDNYFMYQWGMASHPTAIITNSNIGVDFVIREYSSIGSNCVIGDHVSVGPLANISHHSTLGDYSTICGQAAISGGCTIGEGVFIGQGAVVKPDIRIGDGAVIGAGAVVVKDVPPNTVVAGNPACSSPKFEGVSPWYNK